MVLAYVYVNSFFSPSEAMINDKLITMRPSLYTCAFHSRACQASVGFYARPKFRKLLATQSIHSFALAPGKNEQFVTTEIMLEIRSGIIYNVF